jgi:hypothetical protein
MELFYFVISVKGLNRSNTGNGGGYQQQQLKLHFHRKASNSLLKSWLIHERYCPRTLCNAYDSLTFKDNSLIIPDHGVLHIKLHRLPYLLKHTLHNFNI